MDTQISQLLDVPSLKGNRDYVSSTQMFDAIRPVLVTSGFSEADRLKMTFRRLTLKTPRFVMPARQSKFAFGDVVVTGHRMAIGTLEETESEITSRRPDYEAGITSLFTVGEGWISASGISPLSAIEVVVAATKHLHHLQVSPSVKWLATRLDLPIGFDTWPADELKIQIMTNRNGTATSNSVSVNGTGVGTVSFNAVPRPH